MSLNSQSIYYLFDINKNQNNNKVIIPYMIIPNLFFILLIKDENEIEFKKQLIIFYKKLTLISLQIKY